MHTDDLGRDGSVSGAERVGAKAASDKCASASVTYLFRFYMAEHGDLFFDRVLQSSGTATHDLRGEDEMKL